MESSDDQIRRSLNEQKKHELEEQFGAEFGPTDSSLPADVEGEWLEQVAEFERQFSAKGRTSVRAFVGDPPVRPLASIPPSELESELEELLGVLFANNVVVHFGRPVSDAEVYRFITEELLDQEIDDIRMEAMTHSFLYEEFHPDEAADARLSAEDFFMALFSRDRRILWRVLCKEEIRDAAGRESSPERFMKCVEEFYARVAGFTSHGTEVTGVEVEGVYATVRAVVSWSGLNRRTMAVVGGAGEAQLLLRHSDGGGWDIVQACVPGWKEEHP
jgi:hypothetical protein